MRQKNPHSQTHLSDRPAWAAAAAQKLYRQARSRSWPDKIRSALNGGSRRLLDLSEIKAAWTGLGHTCLGQQNVPISQIRGSANTGRRRDFDAGFRPLKSYNEERWLGVAAAWLRGAKLPPVALIRVGDVYFVEDGFHRLSVARALGREEIEAVVTVWEVAGPLPWAEAAEQRRPGRRVRAIPKQAKC